MMCVIERHSQACQHIVLASPFEVSSDNHASFYSAIHEQITRTFKLNI